MDYENAKQAQQSPYAMTGESTEVKPLEDISRIADSLIKDADALDAYLERFNGPTPTALNKAAWDQVISPRCHRGEIERLESVACRISSITDLIILLG